MSNYPPGVSASTPDAPWNQTPPPDCERCGGVYTADGHQTLDDEQICHVCGAEWIEVKDRCPDCGSDDVSGRPCPNLGMDRADYEDMRRGRRADREYERERDK